MTTVNNLENNHEHIDLNQLNIPQNIKDSLLALGYKKFTKFQAQVIKMSSEKKNILAYGINNGKSVAFNIAIINFINLDKTDYQALIVAKKEDVGLIAKQINDLLKGFYASICDKHTPTTQIAVCSQDFLDEFLNNADLTNINQVFLDSIGISETNQCLKSILDKNIKVQWLIFSETNIESVHSYTLEGIEDVCLLENTSFNEIKPIVHIVHQQNDAFPKPRTLLAAIEHHKKSSYLISCNNTEEAFLLDRFLSRYGHEIKMISDERTSELGRFIEDLNNKKIAILLCPADLLMTQDLSKVECLINYNIFDKPTIYEQITQFNKQALGVNRTIVNIASSKELAIISILKAQCQINFEIQSLPSDDEVLALSAKRIIKLINQQAQDVELSQFIELAQKIVKEDDAILGIAYLVKEQFLKRIAHSVRPVATERFSKDSFTRKPREFSKDFKEAKPRKTSYDKERELNKEKDENLAPKPQIIEPEIKEEVQEIIIKERPEAFEPSTNGVAKLYISLGEKDGFKDLTSLASFLSEKCNVDLGHFSGGGMVREQSSHIEVDDEVAQSIIDAINNQEKPNSKGEDELIICERAKQQTKGRFIKKPYRNNYRRG